MRLARKKFVLLFLAFGYAFHFATRLLLNQAPDALWASPDQEAWQRHASTILSPIKVVLVAPINWLQQDPDPPPPFRLILFAAYWSVLAGHSPASVAEKRGGVMNPPFPEWWRTARGMTESAMAKDIRFRRGTPADSRQTFDLSLAAVSDLMARQNHELPFDADSLWKVLESYIAHLAVHAAEWWLAEDASDGSLVGHARSVERGGLFELSELFVRPGFQSSSLGKQLIERAFPRGRGEVRVIIATNDVRALARYYAADTVARFPIASLSGAPQPAQRGELDVVVATMDDLPIIAQLETAVVGYARDADYPWLLREREGLLYRRRNRVVGFAFFGKTGLGPIAALEPADQRFILGDLENRAHASGVEEMSFSVPMINEIAMNHLFSRGFKIDGPVHLFMSNRPFGNFDRFITFGPPIVL